MYTVAKLAIERIIGLNTRDGDCAVAVADFVFGNAGIEESSDAGGDVSRGGGFWQV